MIVKMIQNLEIKMESQINSLEARIEKMQETFNKELEEIKKRISQTARIQKGNPKHSNINKMKR